MKNIKFLDLYSQYISIKDEIDEAIHSVIRDSAFIGGKYVREFEEKFADYMSAKHCIGVANGTDALEIAIEALKLPKGTEIIVPGNSFIASSEAVTRSGHRVVFADVDPDCYTLRAESVSEKLNENTSAIIAVHLYGHPCDMDPLLKLAEENNLRVIEDCAQAHGAQYKGRMVGTIGDVGTFSFYPGKNLGAYGDGGAVVTNDDNLAVMIRKISNHGRIAKYDHDFEGRNSRLDGLQAAILSVKLKHLKEWTEHRVKAAESYLTNLKQIPQIVLPHKETWAKHVYHLFVIRTPLRDQLLSFLKERGVETGIHYPTALPKLPAYSYTGQSDEQFFVNNIDEKLLSLPIGEHLTESDIMFVVSAINEFFISVGENV